MTQERQRFNEEFKIQTVKYIQEQSKSVIQIAEELNINPKTIYQWIAKYRTFENESLANPQKILDLQQQLKEQERQLKKLQKEKEDRDLELAILKKALHIFSKDSP